MSQQTDRLEAHIREVRERMAHRIDDISHEFDSKAFAARFTGKDAPGAGDLLDSFTDVARQHPLSVGLIGLGLTGILAFGSDGYGARMGRRVRETTGEYRNRASAMADDITRRGQRAGESLRDTVSQATESVRDTMHRASDRVRSTADGVRSAADGAGERVTGIAEWVRDNPIASGLMVMAAGAAVASFMAAGRGSTPDVPSAEDMQEAARRLREEEARARETQAAQATPKTAQGFATPVPSGLSATSDASGALAASQEKTAAEKLRALNGGEAERSSLAASRRADIPPSPQRAVR